MNKRQKKHTSQVPVRSYVSQFEWNSSVFFVVVVRCEGLYVNLWQYLTIFLNLYTIHICSVDFATKFSEFQAHFQPTTKINYKTEYNKKCVRSRLHVMCFPPSKSSQVSCKSRATDLKIVHFILNTRNCIEYLWQPINTAKLVPIHMNHAMEIDQNW